ncbi:tetratricopeptide repeat protein [Streptomyces longwoodensis]|uniref:tetratricopeptide repeat protein n=1 Tax=Streptomyces longwoodensis TaxID=68231 RepID=UPI0036FEEC54
MSEGRPSRKGLNRLRRQTGFIGRRHELADFRENFGRDPDSATGTFQYLYHVHGDGGVGKTSLVRQWEAVAREVGAVTAYLDDAVNSPVEAMEAVSRQFGHDGVPLKAFDKLMATYRQRRHEVEAPVTAPPPAGPGSGAGPAGASPGSTVVAQAGLAGLGLVPGLGPVVGALDAQQLAQGTDRLRAMLSARLRNHDDVQLVMSPVRVLTPVFLDDLAEAARRRPWIVLFFDVYEQTGPVLDEWLSDVLVRPDTYPDLPTNLVVVLSGRGPLGSRHWADSLDLVAQVPLEVFTEQEARRLLAARGVTDEDVIQVVLRLSGRLPLLVDLLAQASPQDPREVGDLSGTAVDRFLQWITDPHRRTAALSCALPLQLDEDVYRAVVPAEAADQYPWLRGLPFVTSQAGLCRYHDVVRAPMLRLQRTQSPSRWQQRHTQLADLYAERRRAVEGALPDDPYDRWADAAWREHRLNELYHRLCADPHHVLHTALVDAVHACDQGGEALRRTAQAFSQAGRDSGAEALTEWARRLVPDGLDDATVVPALTHLAAAPELTPAERALAHTVRGREYRDAEQWAQALDAYDTALRLAPDLGRAHYGRGETYRLTGRHSEAITHFTRACALNPEESLYIASRGQAHQGLQQYEEALADLDRAVALDDASSWVFALRGMLRRLMGRPQESLTDLVRAVELDPEDAWALANRGVTHQALDDFDAAVADLTRAVELDPTKDWAIAELGFTLRLMERHEEAVATLDRALALDPDYGWALAHRGTAYRALDRPQESLRDLDRALTLSPGLAWVHESRGATHRVLGNLGQALADFNRALELDPSLWTVHAQRGVTHRLREQYEEAVADLTRAVELDPADVWALGNRGIAHRQAERPEEAVADLTRAIALDDSEGWLFGHRAHALRMLGRYEEALADHDACLRLSGETAWALAERGATHRAMDRPAAALADLTRALDLNSEDSWVHSERGVVHRMLGHYEQALADFARAAETGTEDPWLAVETAFVLRLTGSPREEDQWRRAKEGLAAEVAQGGGVETHARGNLAVVHGALGDWDAAAEELERFLARAPEASRVNDALDDLDVLERILSVDPARLAPLRERLRDHLSGSDARQERGRRSPA